SGKWEELDAAGEIEDLTLDVALPVKELITTARSDDAVARALYLKGNPYLLEKVAEGEAKGEAKGRAEGEAKGRAKALLVVLEGRGLVIDEAMRARLLSERDVQQLDRWLSRAMTCATIDELDREP